MRLSPTIVYMNEHLQFIVKIQNKNQEKAAQIATKTANIAQKSIKQGMTTDDLDKIVHEFIISQNTYPYPIGFMDFPKSVCTSVNAVCCHGIPNLRPLFQIEPILLIPHDQYLMWKDNFSFVSPDNPSTQQEDMILITDYGYEILTRREDETGI